MVVSYHLRQSTLIQLSGIPGRSFVSILYWTHGKANTQRDAYVIWKPVMSYVDDDKGRIMDGYIEEILLEVRRIGKANSISSTIKAIESIQSVRDSNKRKGEDIVKLVAKECPCHNIILDNQRRAKSEIKGGGAQ